MTGLDRTGDARTWDRPTRDRRPRSGRPGLLLAGLFTAGCTTNWYSRQADAEVGEILSEYEQKGLADRATHVRQPEPARPEPPPPEGTIGEPVHAPSAGTEGAAPERPTLRLDLRTTLSIAVRQSREFKSAKEGLYLNGLGFTLTQFQYGPQFSAAVSYLWGDGDGTPAASSLGGSFGVSQLLPTNGSLSLDSNMAKTWARDDFGAADDWSTGTGISFSQPLLRNAGYGTYREGLTQAERNLVYQVRSFELFREQFTINRASDFFDLLGQQKQLANTVKNRDDAKFDLDRDRELQKVERKREEDVVQTERNYLDAESALLNAQANFQQAIERFLIDLGLDPKTPIELVDEEPPFESVSFDPDSAVDVALHNRLDVQTQRELVEDEERRLKLQRLDLYPDLNLTANYGSNGAGQRPGAAFPNQWDRSAGLSLDIPIQQVSERNAWRAAEIRLDQTRRDWDEFLANVRSSIQTQLRDVQNTEQQIGLGKKSVKSEERNVDRYDILQSTGEVRSRDIVEARNKLTDSRNALIEFKVRHLIQRLTLYKDLGLLFIDEEGMWSLGAPGGPQ